MTLPIRPAVLADLSALHDLVHRAYRGDTARIGWTHEADLLDGQRIDAEALTSMLTDPRQRVLVAEDAGHLSGCVQVTDLGNGLAYLGMLAVDPGRQTNGLGRSLITTAEGCASALFSAIRMEMTVLHQRAELIAYYERRGYHLTGERRPFPASDPRFGLPKRDDLAFVVLARSLLA